MNVAFTSSRPLTLTVHTFWASIESHPVHDENTEPPPGVGVSLTTVPYANVVEHAPPVPQAMPAGELATEPLPDLVTFKGKKKVAFTAQA